PTSPTGAHGGFISLYGYTGVTVNGSISASGGNGTLLGGDAGHGGNVYLFTGVDPSLGNLAIVRGNVRVTGSITSNGGSSSVGDGGHGGLVALDGSTVQVLGSIKALAGKGVNSYTGGFVAIRTNNVQPVPLN